ncbi:glycosyl transferase family protein [Roseomonas aeriglobus]|nr:glycosyl transferase family protein [Roseomonas aeriglobus]
MDWGVSTEFLAALSYELTLFAAVGMMVGGIDDCVVDAIYLWHRIRRWWRGERTATLADMRPRARRLAIFIAAWDESAVIGRMLAALSRNLASSRLTVFVGAYPNDRATIDAIVTVAEADPRIRLVVNIRPGPTTKADCLNAIWRSMRVEEDAIGAPFDAIILHDAEDLVHPAELTVIDHYLSLADAVQLPVIPLPHHDASLVGGTYLDEFAEAHGKTLVVRSSVGAGLPLAGVGCAISRPLLGKIAALRGGHPFDADSLTEDYELGLTIAAMGGRMRFAQVQTADGPPVAVQAYFPKDFLPAARQKSRWMIGIALAGWDRIGWGRAPHLGEWWMRLRDRRAPIGIIVLLAAYMASVLMVICGLIDLWGTDMPSLPGSLVTLLYLNVVLLLWRMLVRAYFVHRLYGWKEALRSAPRMLIGNLVAMEAARRALTRYLAMLRGAPTRWEKTAHQFPDETPKA